MRSNKQRSRSKQNRNRTVGNVINRVFDSSGPEGKVRGTPQQIIDKYNQLARDAQLSGDRVAMENFQQHSEHYTRMLAEAAQEEAARREQQDAQSRERQQNNPQNNPQHTREDRGSGDQPQPQASRENAQPQPQPQREQPQREQPQREQPRARAKAEDQPQPDAEMPAELMKLPDFLTAPPVKAERTADDVIDVSDDAESGLVETPESKPEPKPRARRPRKPRAAPDSNGSGPAEAAE